MTRTVVNTSEVTHLWAHQSQAVARNSGHSVFFEGSTIYSFGSHFPMARHVDGAVLITTRSYSVTTSKHQGYVRQACSHLTRFYVDNVSARSKREHRENLALMRDEYENLIVKASRARVWGQQYLNQAERCRQDANEYSAFFKLTTRIKPADVESIKERAKKAQAKAKTAKRKELARRKFQWQKEEANWRNGGSSLPHAYQLPPILRLIDDTVQTSHGARFPAEHARKALPVIVRCKEKGREWKRNGHAVRLGPYQLDSIDVNGNVVAGCHRVAFSEVEYIAGLL